MGDIAEEMLRVRCCAVQGNGAVGGLEGNVVLVDEALLQDRKLGAGVEESRCGLVEKENVDDGESCCGGEDCVVGRLGRVEEGWSGVEGEEEGVVEGGPMRG